MPKYTPQKYYIVMKGDSPINIDMDSGGYPYSTPLNKAYIWQSREAAEKYAKHNTKELRVVEIEIHLLETQ